jgi:hypothetical protein
VSLDTDEVRRRVAGLDPGGIALLAERLGLAPDLGVGVATVDVPPAPPPAPPPGPAGVDRVVDDFSDHDLDALVDLLSAGHDPADGAPAGPAPGPGRNGAGSSGELSELAGMGEDALDAMLDVLQGAAGRPGADARGTGGAWVRPLRTALAGLSSTAASWGENGPPWRTFATEVAAGWRHADPDTLSPHDAAQMGVLLLSAGIQAGARPGDLVHVD